MIKILQLLCLFFLSQISVACTCSPFSTLFLTFSEIESYDLVIKGKVIGYDTLDWSTKSIRVKVAKTYFGKAISDTVSILSHTQGSACGIFPKLGADWLFFSYNDSVGYRTSSCTRSASLNDNQYFTERNIEILENYVRANQFLNEKTNALSREETNRILFATNRLKSTEYDGYNDIYNYNATLKLETEVFNIHYLKNNSLLLILYANEEQNEAEIAVYYFEDLYFKKFEDLCIVFTEIDFSKKANEYYLDDYTPKFGFLRRE